MCVCVGTQHFEGTTAPLDEGQCREARRVRSYIYPVTLMPGSDTRAVLYGGRTKN